MKTHQNVRTGAGATAAGNVTARRRHTSPSPASLRPPSSPPSPQPSRTVRQQQGERKSRVRGHRSAHAVNESPALPGSRPRGPDLLHAEGMSETSPPAEERHSHGRSELLSRDMYDPGGEAESSLRHQRELTDRLGMTAVCGRT